MEAKEVVASGPRSLGSPSYGPRLEAPENDKTVLMCAVFQQPQRVESKDGTTAQYENEHQLVKEGPWLVYFQPFATQLSNSRSQNDRRAKGEAASGGEGLFHVGAGPLGSLGPEPGRDVDTDGCSPSLAKWSGSAALRAEYRVFLL